MAKLRNVFFIITMSGIEEHFASSDIRVIVQTVFLAFFSAFIASMPSKVMIIVIQVMILGINMFWAPHSHYNPRLAARAKKDSESGPNSVVLSQPLVTFQYFC